MVKSAYYLKAMSRPQNAAIACLQKCTIKKCSTISQNTITLKTPSDELCPRRITDPIDGYVRRKIQFTFLTLQTLAIYIQMSSIR